MNKAPDLNYTDTEKGEETTVFFHGTPSSSHEYSEVIDILKARYRCVAIDMLGFGASKASADSDFSLPAQASYISSQLENLEISSCHIVAGDFGGPIAMKVLEIGNITPKSITLFNTWIGNPAVYKEIEKASAIVNSWLGKFLYLHMGFSTNVLAKQAFKDKALYKKLKATLNKPFPTPDSRKVLYKFAQELTQAEDFYRDTERYYEKLDKNTIQLLWGTSDKLLPVGMLNDWKNRHEVTETEAGHFIPYEMPEWLAERIDSHISNVIATQ